MSKPNPSRVDPTRLNGLRRKSIALLRKGYANLARMIRHLLLVEHALGRPTVNGVFNESWSYETNPNKIKRFREWLRQRMGTTLAGDAVIESLIDQAYTKGLSRSHNDISRSRKRSQMPVDRNKKGTRRSIQEISSIQTSEHDQSKVEERNFVRMRKSRQATIEKVKLLASRTFHEIDGINQRMASTMSKYLAEGLAVGRTVNQITKAIVRETKLGFLRASTIVRTELVRAHAEGQLDALEALGEEKIGVAVEWQSMDDDVVCIKCRSMEGKIFKIEEARGKIPLHSMCRCAWIPLSASKAKSRVDSSKRRRVK